MSEPLRPEDRDAAEAALAQRTNERIATAEAWADQHGITSPPEQSVAKAAALKHQLADILSDKRRKKKSSDAAPVADMTRRQKSTESSAASWSFEDAPAPVAAGDQALAPSQVDPETGEILGTQPTAAAEEFFPVVDQVSQADNVGMYSDPFPEGGEPTADEVDWSTLDMSESGLEPESGESEPLPFPSDEAADLVDPFDESPNQSPTEESPPEPESALESGPASDIEQELDDVWAALVREEGQPP